MTPAARKGLKLTELVSDASKSIAELPNRPGHKTLAVWATDCAERVLPYFEEKYPEDHRPRRAIEACREWVKTGVFRMADVRKASLSAHAAARSAVDDGNDAACFAARAAGQAAATPHVAGHAKGSAAYAVKAVAAHSADTDVVKERNWQDRHLRDLAGGRIHPH